MNITKKKNIHNELHYMRMQSIGQQTQHNFTSCNPLHLTLCLSARSNILVAIGNLYNLYKTL